MKRLILLLLLILLSLISCTKGNEGQIENKNNDDIQFPCQFLNGAVNIIINNDTDILTKSDDADYYTIMVNSLHF